MEMSLGLAQRCDIVQAQLLFFLYIYIYIGQAQAYLIGILKGGGVIEGKEFKAVNEPIFVE